MHEGKQLRWPSPATCVWGQTTSLRLVIEHSSLLGEPPEISPARFSYVPAAAGACSVCSLHQSPQTQMGKAAKSVLSPSSSHMKGQLLQPSPAQCTPRPGSLIHWQVLQPSHGNFKQPLPGWYPAPILMYTSGCCRLVRESPVNLYPQHRTPHTSSQHDSGCYGLSQSGTFPAQAFIRASVCCDLPWPDPPLAPSLVH